MSDSSHGFFGDELKKRSKYQLNWIGARSLRAMPKVLSP
jgi:hypothetical protein